MGIFSRINLVTVILAALFIFPILFGVISPFSSRRMQRSMGSLLNSLVFLGAVIAAVYLTGRLLADDSSPVLDWLYNVVPPLKSLLESRDIWVYAAAAVLLTALIYLVLYLLTMPLYRFVLVPLTEKFSSTMGKLNGAVRRLLGGLWELPKAVIGVVVFSLLLSFIAAYSAGSFVEKSISASAAYRYIDKAVIDPLLSSELAQKIPVLLDNTFKKAASSLEARNIRLIRYFNGMTLEDAVKSNADIDAEALKQTARETDTVKKAKLLYTWIAQNITYDEKKAAAVSVDPTGVPSGAVVAYKTKTGICFDDATLYVAMCRACGIKVRFVTGLGYSGTAWGDHAWNQVWDPAGSRWINVDPTFGISGKNYFDRAAFGDDHQDAVVQGEW